jgi:hypothetical protein
MGAIHEVRCTGAPEKPFLPAPGARDRAILNKINNWRLACG